MRYSKFLILVISITITQQQAYAACTGTNCFNDGINFANQIPSGSISNSIIESAVGKEKFTEAVITKDSLANQMGGEYKNVDKMSNAGNQKLQNCVGKSSSDCNAVSYYNDPLMRQKQQGIESSVGIASYLLNKQIQQDVDFASYCKNNPNDSMCKICKDNPNQSMCQNGNKCTTITYQSTEGSQKQFSCEIIGQRSYACNKWIDNVLYHINYIPATYLDGGTVQAIQKSNNCDTGSSTYNYQMNNDSAWMRIVTHKSDISLNRLYVQVSASSGATYCAWIDGYLTMLPSSTEISIGATYIDWHSGRKGNIYLSQTAGSNCTGNTCTIGVKLSGNDINQVATITFPYPKDDSKVIVIDNVIWKDNCSK